MQDTVGKWVMVNYLHTILIATEPTYPTGRYSRWCPTNMSDWYRAGRAFFFFFFFTGAMYVRSTLFLRSSPATYLRVNM